MTAVAERHDSFPAEATPAGINRIAFSADGRLMAISRTDMSIELFEQGELLRTLYVSTPDEKVRPTERVRGLAFGNRNDRLFVASADQVRCFGLQPQVRDWAITPPRSFGFLVSSPLAISVSSADYVAATFDNGSLGLWSPDGDRMLLRRESNAPRAIDFADHDRLMIGTDGFSLCSWNTHFGRPETRRLLTERAYHSACWSQGSLVAIRYLSSFEVMDIQDTAPLWRRQVGPGLPLLAFDARSGRLAVPEEHQLTIYDPSGTQLSSHAITGGAITSLSFNPLTGEVVIGKVDGTLDTVGE